MLIDDGRFDKDLNVHTQSRAPREWRNRPRVALAGRRLNGPPATSPERQENAHGVKPDEPDESGCASITPFNRGTITWGLSSGLAV
jgi:hypothetical protein